MDFKANFRQLLRPTEGQIHMITDVHEIHIAVSRSAIGSSDATVKHSIAIGGGWSKKRMSSILHDDAKESVRFEMNRTRNLSAAHETNTRTCKVPTATKFHRHSHDNHYVDYETHLYCNKCPKTARGSARFIQVQNFLLSLASLNILCTSSFNEIRREHRTN